MAMAPSLSLLLFLSLLLSFSLLCNSQQGYLNNAQDNCYATNASTTLGYTCNGASTTCTSYLIFRATASYNSPALVAFLLSADAVNISALNNITAVTQLPAGEILLVPTTCACAGSNYQHNASYTIQSQSETYLIIANDTYGGLSTCQALISQNPNLDSRHLVVNNKLLVPLRCACPTTSQIKAGAKYLLTYVVTWGDDVRTLADQFHADYQSVLDANGLTSKSVIYPFTTLLIPIATAPTRDEILTSPPPATAPATPPPAEGGGGGGSSNKWVFIGIGIGVAFLLLCGIPLGFCCWQRRHRRQPLPPGKMIEQSSVEYADLPGKQSAPLMTREIRKAVESLAVYKFEELERATGFFGEEHRIKGSVYRGVINGDDAVVKSLKGDVSDEINILRQINHSNIIRLSGFCINEGNTYLVYEFAEKGSLSDWLHHKDLGDDSYLSWKQRAQIAYDVADGLNYLHNYASPTYVHKNLKSSNILLGGDLRAKVANFGLARSVDVQDDAPQLTRHVVGTQGYMAPEYLEHGLITNKLDVFAFGVVMLELLSGKEAALPKDAEVKGEALLWMTIEPILNGEDVRSKLRGFIDPLLQNDYPFELAFAMADLARRCVARDPVLRPAVAEVLTSLSAIYNSSLDWDPSDVASSGPMNYYGR